jgi:xanthine dehydrogenase accessory factor
MDNIYKAINEILNQGEQASLATIVSKQGSTPAPVGAKMIVKSNNDIVGTVGGGRVESEIRQIAIKTIGDGLPKLVSINLSDSDSICGGSISVFIEPIISSEKIFIFGAGHIAQPLSKMAVLTGFNVTIIDDRQEYANPDRFSEADKIITSDYEDASNQLEIDYNSFIVIITRGHSFDQQVLEWACGTKAKYIGMIGSKTKIQQVFDNLRQKGVDDKKIAEVHAPIGLEIGSETPSEIAVSILAEIIKVRHQKKEKK